MDGRVRVVIEKVEPCVEEGGPVRRCPGEAVHVSADVFSDGHDAVRAELLFRPVGQEEWIAIPMDSIGNDRWEGTFRVEARGEVVFTVRAWVDHLETLLRDLGKKGPGQVGEVDCRILAEELRRVSLRASGDDSRLLDKAAAELETSGNLKEAEGILGRPEIRRCSWRYPDPQLVRQFPETRSVAVERRKMRFSSWYEFFPRSACLPFSREGTLREARLRLGESCPNGFRRRLPASYPSNRDKKSQGQEQHTGDKTRRSGKPLGDWFGPGRARRG